LQLTGASAGSSAVQQRSAGALWTVEFGTTGLIARS
jgi:hypothetical protein